MALMDGGGTSAGSATTSGGTAVDLVGAGTAIGLALVLGAIGALWTGGATSAGAATASAPGVMLLGPGGTAAGSATTGSPTPTMLFGGDAVAAGQATSSGAANVDGVLAGSVAGAATVFAESHPFGAGTAAGSGSLAGAQGIYNAGGTGTAVGAATTTATAGVSFISTGQVAGQATVSFSFTQDSDGFISGLATVTGSGLVIRNGRGFIFGTSSMVWSYPLPMVGTTTMVAHAVVETHFPPINAIVAPPKSFRWLQLLQRGDLPIFLSDQRGPVSPWAVTYTLFQRRPDGTRFQVGPGQKTPVSGDVGEFYATGRAGELGQPGDWTIRWEFQRSFEGALQTEEMEFRVLDAVLAADPLDATVRIRKFGWS